MKLLHTITETKQAISDARNAGKVIGLVPTMGALHEGHLSLIQNARRQCDFVVVSVFVNPTQFGPSEDFNRYPRTLEDDAHKCEQAGVDLIFAPDAQEMYPPGFDSWVEIGGVTTMLEGESRPGHFKGVATVCLKLFNIIQADRAYFGQKDYQQLQVIKKMVRDLNVPIEIVQVQTVRESDGLALSSRNRYLNDYQRQAALILQEALKAAKRVYESGQRDGRALEQTLRNTLSSQLLAEIDYAVVVDAETLLPIDNIDRPVVALLAVRIGTTRLIDNLILTD
ncbi:MAG: pantoate--beta-alanine ligase [Armatimonadota bacterium]